MLGLAFLTQSRGVMIGLIAGGVVSLAIGPDRVRRAWLALFAVALVAIASPNLLDPYDAFTAGATTVSGGEISSAARALLVIVVGGFVIGLALAVFDNGLRTSSRAADRLRQAAVAGLMAVIAASAIGALVAIGNPVSYADQKLDEFTDLRSTTSDELDQAGNGRRSAVRPLARGLERVLRRAVDGCRRGQLPVRLLPAPPDRPQPERRAQPSAPAAGRDRSDRRGPVRRLLVALGVAIVARARRATGGRSALDRRPGGGGAAMVAQTLTDWLWLLPGLLGLAFLALALAAAEGR